MNALDNVDPEDIRCPACESSCPTGLGVLGRLMHFRCRACGMDFSRRLDA